MKTVGPPRNKRADVHRMPSWIYCGTAEQVNSAYTQDLLRNHQAIWCPPPRVRPWPQRYPKAGEVLWLVWRENHRAPILVLGRGTIWAAPRQLFGTTVLWTDPDHRGMRDAAMQLGYGGGNAMSFLRLENICLSPIGGVPPIQDLIGIQDRFNVANAVQLAIIQQTPRK